MEVACLVFSLICSVKTRNGVCSTDEFLPQPRREDFLPSLLSLVLLKGGPGSSEFCIPVLLSSGCCLCEAMSSDLPKEVPLLLLFFLLPFVFWPVFPPEPFDLP